MGALHRFVRLQLWRLAGALGVLFVLATVFGVRPVLLLLEWTPMALCVLVVAAEARNALGRMQRRRR
jgi:hypothetical protein